MDKKIQTHSWYSVALLTAGHFFSDFYSNFLPVLLPIVIPKLGLSLTLSGLLIMVLSFTSNVMQPFFGYLIDKKNLNWLLYLTVPASAIFICYTGFADTKTLLFILVALNGLSISIFHPLASSLVSKVSATSKLGLSISFFVAGGNLGFAFAPIIIIYFTNEYGLSALPLLILPSIVLTWTFYKARITKKSSSSNQVNQRTDTVLQPFISTKYMDLIKLNIAMGLRAWTHVSITTFLPVLLVSQAYSTLFAGAMLTIFLVGAALGGLYGGYLNDKIGYKKVIVASLTLGIVPTYLFLINTEITWWSMIVLFFCGACLQGAAPSSLVWAQNLLPNNAGVASGMMLGLSFGLGGIGAAITGTIADYISLPSSLLMTTIPLACAALTTLTIPEKANTLPRKE